MLKVIKSKIGETKKGARIWIEGTRLEQAGFSKGSEYALDDQGNKLTLRLTQGVGRKVSARRGLPIIDLVGKWVSDKFNGYTRVKIVIMDGLIRIAPDVLEKQINDCREVLRNIIANDESVPYIDIFTGGATSSKALEHGAKGKLKTALHIECDPYYSEYADRNHPDSISYNAFIQDVDLEDIPKVPMVVAYFPCDDFSNQGKAKKGLKQPEMGNTGYLYHYVMNILRQSSANYFLAECVPNFQTSNAAAMVRKILGDLGFKHIDEAILEAPDFGDLTRRKRWVMLASRTSEVCLPRSVPHTKRKLVDILDTENEEWLTPENSKTIDYLVNVHSAKHTAKGNGFGLLNATHLASDDYMPTICRSYGKLQPSALLRKSENENAWRMFTPQEVARAHGIPDGAMELPESKTRAYEILGQGTCWGMFEAIGAAIIKHIKKEALTSMPCSTHKRPVQAPLFA